MEEVVAVPLDSTVGKLHPELGLAAGQLHPASKHYNPVGQAVGVEDPEAEEAAGE